MHKQHKSFEDVKAWKLGRDFKNKIYNITQKYPQYELYCLCQQIRRATIPITANIAEGYGRYSFQENINFCRMSRGSVLEVLDHLFTAMDQGYISRKEFEDLYRQGREAEKAINGYISFLQGQK